MHRDVFKTRGGTAASRICLGTGSFGAGISEDDSFAVLDAYAQAGGNFLDTAHIYAAWVEGGWGASERTIGKWLAMRGNRGRMIIATKGGHPPLDALDQGRCSREALHRDLSESLERLGVDFVDLYWLHRDDPGRPVEEIVDILAELAAEGHIGAYGASNWTRPRIEAANRYAQTRGAAPFVASQPGWSLAERPAHSIPVPGMRYLDEEERRWHEETQFPVVAYTSQAQGYFSESNVAWARSGFPGDPPHGREYDSPDNRRRLQAAAELARQKACTAVQIALAYILSQPFPAYAIVGTSKAERIPEIMEAEGITLSETRRAYLRA